jgi:hypothetical protein
MCNVEDIASLLPLCRSSRGSLDDDAYCVVRDADDEMCIENTGARLMKVEHAQEFRV